MAGIGLTAEVTTSNYSVTTYVSLENTSVTAEPTYNDIMPKMMNITLMVIGIATVLMNIFVITIILVFKWMRSNANIIIGSMAVTDLLMGLVTLTAGAIKWTNWFSIRGIFCQVFFTVDIWGTMTSLAHVLAVNGERYLAIVFPLKYKNIVSLARIRIILLVIWIMTLLEASAYASAYQMGENCQLVGMSIPILAIGFFIISIVVPFMAKTSSIKQSILVQSQRKMFAIVSAILAVWIICWLPMMCVILVMTGAETLDIHLDASQFVDMLYYTEVMAYGNSLLNPILYFLLSTDFRKAGLLLFKFKSQGSSESTTAGVATVEIEIEDTYM